MKQITSVLLALSFIILGTAQSNGRTMQLLDDNWEFQLTDDNGKIHEWQNVDLPHDWSITFDFDADAPAGNDGGYLPTGLGHYRKALRLNDRDIDKVNRLYLEGVYMNSTVIVNGDTIGYRPYGYSSVIYDISPALRSDDNVIEVIADNSQQKNSRWYSGSGIYRHVWLLQTDPVHVIPWTLQVTTDNVSATTADIHISAQVAAPDSLTPDCLIAITQAGRTVAHKTVKVTDGKVNADFTITQPELWSPETPALYEVSLTISDAGNTYDTVSETFGIRSFTFTADDGLRLNGKPLTLYGGCVHHDNGLLGARSYDAAEARKVSLLKQAGFNAVRTSHNPPSPAFFDECDRQGLIVIDEAFDGWREHKNDHDYAGDFDEWWLRDIEAMVLRDRNHPSVMAWSTGNEVIERKKIEVVTTARRLAEACRRLDPTRPVTSALAAWDSDWEIYDPLAAEHEITGYNYMIFKSESDHERVPDRVMWQTESFPHDAFPNWVKVNDYPYIIGDFVWTAIDYLGESGIGRHYYEGDTPGEHWEHPQWPWHGAYCGDIDLLGQRKPVSHYRQMLFAPDETVYMAVREPDGYYGKIRETMWGTYPTWESWTWPGHEGRDIEVEVISRQPLVRLYLDDTLLGEMPTDREHEFKARFTVPYRPGTLRAEAIDTEGNTAGTAQLRTAGTPHAIRLTADKTIMKADNQDLVYLTAEVVDSEGTVVPDCDVTLRFDSRGPAEIIATGSADLKDTAGYTRPERKVWKGRAGAVVKSTPCTGTSTITVTASGLRPAKITLDSKK